MKEFEDVITALKTEREQYYKNAACSDNETAQRCDDNISAINPVIDLVELAAKLYKRDVI